MPALRLFLAAMVAPAMAQSASPIASFAQLFERPVAAKDIAGAVGDCVEADGGADRLADRGWKRVEIAGLSGEMLPYRRDPTGPVLVLPAVANPLRCWVMASPSDDRVIVVNAIGARLQVPNRGNAASPAWRTKDHTLTFDWMTAPGKPQMMRVEVYKFPQESK
ncbi:MAG: hypothetical protein PGN21_11890 [Sphingomonas paucimobilis]